MHVSGGVCVCTCQCMCQWVFVCVHVNACVRGYLCVYMSVLLCCGVCGPTDVQCTIHAFRLCVCPYKCMNSLGVYMFGLTLPQSRLTLLLDLSLIETKAGDIICIHLMCVTSVVLRFDPGGGRVCIEVLL